jgi:hypothetical protein
LWGIWDIATKYGASISFDPVITPRDDGDKSPLEMAATKDFLVRFFSDEYKELRYGRDVTKRDDSVVRANCGTGRTSFTIDPYGTSSLCAVAPEVGEHQGSRESRRAVEGLRGSEARSVGGGADSADHLEGE